jgi:DHA1 family bicyclomycin/chloramphenicol resistance-like MFS transporter
VTFLFLPESHIPDPSISLRPGPILLGFTSILKQPQFLTYALAGAFSFAGLFAYVAGSPIIFIDGYHVSEAAFGGVFAVLTMGFIGGNQVNVFLVRRFSSEQIFSAALTAQVVTGLLFVAGTRSSNFGMIPTLVLFFVFLSCIGLTYPNAAAIALAPFSKNTGSASALLGFLQMGTGAVVSTGIGLFGASAITAIVGLLAGSAVVSLLILLAGRRYITETAVREDNESLPLVH